MGGSKNKCVERGRETFLGARAPTWRGWAAPQGGQAHLWCPYKNKPWRGSGVGRPPPLARRATQGAFCPSLPLGLSLASTVGGPYSNLACGARWPLAPPSHSLGCPPPCGDTTLPLRVCTCGVCQGHTACVAPPRSLPRPHGTNPAGEEGGGGERARHTSFSLSPPCSISFSGGGQAAEWLVLLGHARAPHPTPPCPLSSRPPPWPSARRQRHCTGGPVQCTPPNGTRCPPPLPLDLALSHPAWASLLDSSASHPPHFPLHPPHPLHPPTRHTH